MNKFKILITEKIEQRCIDRLKSKFSVTVEPELWQYPDRLKNIIPNYHAVIIRNRTNLNDSIIEAGTSLTVIGRAGTGLDNINVEAATDMGIVVVSTPDQNSISVAELTIAMMLILARNIFKAHEHVRDGGWNRQRFIGTELYGKTLGIIGLGRIGSLTALRAQAFGMNIIAYDSGVDRDSPTVQKFNVEFVGLQQLLKKADFVSCHLPLTPHTNHFFTYDLFSKMKPSAFFLNLARGEVVDEEGLIRALKEKKIAGAGLDVRKDEPPEKSPLLFMDNVVHTPHMAAFTYEAQKRVASALCEDIISILEGKGAENYVNFPKPKGKIRTESTF